MDLLSVHIQVFSFIQFYYVCFSSHKNISNFCNLLIVKLFVFWVRVCRVRISIMVRFIIANIRGYRCVSAGLRVGWFLHWFREVKFHLDEERRNIYQIALNVCISLPLR